MTTARGNHALEWERDGADWPNRPASRFVQAGNVRFHVQVMGSGPVLLLLHGAGASTHSWRDLAPLLALHHTLVMPDLPGHGFTTMPPSSGMTTAGMAASVAALLAALELMPAAAVGHSAGAGLMLRMAIDGRIAGPLVAINGAMLPFPGIAARLFPGLARLLFANPFLPSLVAAGVRGGSLVERFLDRTGSRLDARGTALYARLFGSPGHVAGMMGMMANWDLDALERDLPRLADPLTLIAGDRDGTVPPAVSRQVAARVPGARLVVLPGLGHLAHEEAPGTVAACIDEALAPGGVR